MTTDFIKIDQPVFCAEFPSDDERNKYREKTDIMEALNAATVVFPIGPTIEAYAAIRAFNRANPQIPDIQFTNAFVLLITKDEREMAKQLSRKLYQEQQDGLAIAEYIIKNQTNTCVVCQKTFDGYGYDPKPYQLSSQGQRCCPNCFMSKIIPAQRKQSLKASKNKFKSRKKCRRCGVPETKQLPLLMCSTCKKVFYCDKKCQRQDWAIHKHRCCSLKTTT